jgi:hypothetical protein
MQLKIGLDNNGNLLLTDDQNYRLVLRPVGTTGEFLYKVLVARQMQQTELGQPGAPTQHEVESLSDQINMLRKRKAEEARKALPAANVEFDL